MNLLTDLEYSAIILVVYIIIRSESSRHFGGKEETKGATAIIIFIGILIFIFINRIIGILIIVLGIGLILIPDKRETEEVEK